MNTVIIVVVNALHNYWIPDKCNSSNYRGKEMHRYVVVVAYCESCTQTHQWRIQDFPKLGVPTPLGGAKVRYGDFRNLICKNETNLDAFGSANAHSM